MEAISSQFRELYAKADEDGQRKLMNGLRDLQQSVDSDWEILLRIGSGNLQSSLVAIGVDMKLFEYLCESEKSLSIDELMKKSGASKRLLTHILHSQAAFGFIKETGVGQFSSNRLTKLLAQNGVAKAASHVYEIHGPVHLILPEYLKEIKYQDITSNKYIAFHKAFKTDISPFQWMTNKPHYLEGLGHALTLQRTNDWTDSFPVGTEVGEFSGESVFVDVGGGFGGQAAQFRARNPNLPGRVIVQDIPATLDKAPATDGIEFMVQDFFQPQLIKGAKFYYLRHVLHDWPDNDSIKILKNIIPAMGPDSRIIIDEVVMPDSGVPWQASYMDLAMMGCLGGLERLRSEWEQLMTDAGLKILTIHKYDPNFHSAIVAVPK